MEKDILDKINNLGVDDTIKSAIKEYAISGENEKNNLWILGITFVGMVIAFALLSWFGFSALNNLRVFVISLITIFSFLGGLIFIVKQILKNSRRMKYTQELYIKLIETERSLLNGKLMCYNQASEITKLKKENEDLRAKCSKLEKTQPSTEV